MWIIPSKIVEESRYIVCFSVHEVTVLMCSTPELTSPVAMISHNNSVMFLQICNQFTFCFHEIIICNMFVMILFLFNLFVFGHTSFEPHCFEPFSYICKVVNLCWFKRKCTITNMTVCSIFKLYLIIISENNFSICILYLLVEFIT